MGDTKTKKMYGAIEAGGTKFVCAVGSGPDNVISKTIFPTTTPKETLGKAIEFFRQTGATLAGIRIASFGPLDLDKKSPTYGYITTTPKPGWADTDLVKPFHDTFNISVSLDTDVNGAALGEGKWGAAVGLNTFIYLTIGTGIGGGAIINGNPLHGLIHPEMGHILIPRDLAKDPFKGCCPYHGDCFEGLASGTAVAKRWGKAPGTLPPDHPAWQLEAYYIATGVVNLILTLSPQKVILGGGIMKTPGLLQSVQVKVQSLLNHYVNSPAINENISSYIVAPGLGDMAGGFRRYSAGGGGKWRVAASG
jgi:fructokinase